MSEDRFDRIERKLDDIATALNTLARVEERITHQRAELDSLKVQSKDHESRITSAERRLDAGAVRIGYGERIWWLIVSGALAVAWVFGRGK